MSQRADLGGLHELLRNSVPGYFFVILLTLLWLDRIRRVLPDATLAALLVVGGPIAGVLLFNCYHFVYKELVWNIGEIRDCLGLKHVTKLKQQFDSSGMSDNEMSAFWDYVLFSLRPRVRDRALFLFSRAHSFGSIALALSVIGVAWHFFGGGNTLPISSLVLVLALIVFAFPYRFAVEQAAALEFLLLTLNWNRVRIVAREYVERGR